ncbi:MAG: hypothetical protein LBJ57_02725 [Prevotellaceae bacterium]|jgi:hypothetical protein|nr:hypothetical protein [Prevotellaceae bacterium]
MTYKEWITATASRFTIGAADVELILFNQRTLIPDENAEANAVTAKKALCKEFSSLIPLADVGEGGFSISWNWEAIKFWYSQACAEVGIVPKSAPKIRDKSSCW